MKTAPLILVSPGTEEKGAEFYDYSISLSQTYLDALSEAGGLPVVLPCAPSPKAVAEFVSRVDGIMLTGGDDIQPELYDESPAPELRKTVGRNDPRRDLLETLLIREAFAQRKPLLAICRGHQLLNVTLGGTLFIDIPSQCQTGINHCRLEHKDRPVHDVDLAPGSLIRSIFGTDKISVNSSHHQAVQKVAPALQVTGRSPDGIVEAMELRKEDANLLPFLLSVQFHPERLTRAQAEFSELFRSFTSVCALNRCDYEGENSGSR